MRAARHARVYNDLTSTARKIYDTVPIGEPWTTHQISAELLRNGTPKDRPILVGCLNSLVRDGLVIERPTDYWVRTAVDPEPEPKAAPVLAAVPKDNPVPAAPVAHPTPLERISTLAEHARKLSRDMAAFADSIDSTALAIDQEIADMGTRTQKLDQLQALLKGLV